MTETTPAKKPRSKLATFLIGTAIGCGALTVLTVGGCTACVVWLNSPGEVLVPERLLAGDTVGYVEWTVDLEQPGTRELLDALFARIDALQRRAAPEGGFGTLVAQLQQWSRRRNEEDLRKLFPVVVAATMRPSGDGAYGVLVAGSARGIDHRLVLADWVGTALLRRSLDAEVLTHADETILVLPRNGRRDAEPHAAVFLRDGEVYVATTVDEARRAVDLLAGRTPPPSGVAPVSRWYAEAPATALRGALANGDDELDRLWDAIRPVVDGDEPASPDVATGGRWREVEGVVVSGGLDDTGAFAIDLTFDLTSMAAAASAEAEIVRAVTGVVTDSIFRVRGASTVGDRVRVTVATPPLADAIGKIPIDDRDPGR